MIITPEQDGKGSIYFLAQSRDIKTNRVTLSEGHTRLEAINGCLMMMNSQHHGAKYHDQV